jgi:hypothetical protein
MKTTLLLSVVLISVLVLTSGCVQVEEGDGYVAPSEATIEQTIDNTVASFDETDVNSFNSVEGLVDLGPGAIPQFLELLDDDDPYSKWAALYALSRVSHQADSTTKEQVKEKLQEYYDSDVTSFRVIAAGAALTLGDKEGIPVLIEGLENQDMLMLTEPPQLICQFSYSTLEHYTQTSYGIICDWDTTDSRTWTGWQSWWNNNKDNLTWDSANKVFNT